MSIGKLCEKTGSECSGSCDDAPKAPPQPSWAANLLKSSFYNALDLCFDDVKAEPKRILMIGGCRQRDFAQYIALVLPGSEIVLVDPDAEEARKAKEEICCRFKFIDASLEALPFEDDAFDLTFAHNLLEFTEYWPQALSEIARVTTGNFLMTVHNPAQWTVGKLLPGMKEALAATGVTLPATLPDRHDLMTRLWHHGRVTTKLAPFPWTFLMMTMNPVREERLRLADVS